MGGNFLLRNGLSYVCWCLLLLAVGSCSSGANAAGGEDVAPTMHPYFEWGSATPSGSPTATQPVPAEDATPTTHPLFVYQEMPTPLPTNTRRPTATPRPTETPGSVSPDAELDAAEGVFTTSTGEGTTRDIVVYDDGVVPGWSLGESWDTNYQQQAIDFIHNGDYALSVSPTADFGALFFTVSTEAAEEFLYDDILGVSFWINAGEEPLAMSDMAVSVLGSNAHPYFTANDESVDFGEGEDFFSETRLYFLEFNRDLPPGEWVEVVIWLDDLLYDPDYTYITGLYLKNDAGYRGTYYVDDLVLIAAAEE